MASISDLATLPLKVFHESIQTSDSKNSPFALTEVFLRSLNQSPDKVILHYWPMPKTVILGMLDRQLPAIEEGYRFLTESGYDSVVRNLGGLAVVADPGILNFTLLFPDGIINKCSITDGYLFMVELIRKAFSDYYQTIEHFEIEDSYCPGTFDLSINGQKFAGLAQRRIKNAIAISIYLSVSGNQSERGQLIREFYKLSKANQKTNYHYPEVRPESMATISELLNDDFTVEEVEERVLLAMRQLGFEPSSLELSQADKEWYKRVLDTEQ